VPASCRRSAAAVRSTRRQAVRSPASASWRLRAPRARRGRPTRLLDLQIQFRRHPLRCQPITVSGRTTTRYRFHEPERLAGWRPKEIDHGCQGAVWDGIAGNLQLVAQSEIFEDQFGVGSKERADQAEDHLEPPSTTGDSCARIPADSDLTAVRANLGEQGRTDHSAERAILYTGRTSANDPVRAISELKNR